ncbi:hypothetical protein [Microbacterium sp. zg-YB36]|uniref:hypothetical protein n=1 Tax=Microbacterium sp. zg-YB36 TaxID=2969407 RepID=UPI00214AD8CD|nr:hypothetical protein [Microbacterium sp. zg-YB36]MDL5351145.1 hypothetical protein [Microbacterium sp. zg-YB36]
MSITLTNAAQSAFYASHDRTEDAGPDWDTLSPAERQEHREYCPDACATCENNRFWGTCSSCGVWPVEADDDGYGCCGSVIILEIPREDNMKAWAA